MNIQPDVLLISRCRSFARGGSVVVMLAGCLVLLGWAFDITALKTLLLGTLPMFANTAVAFLFAGASLRLALCNLAGRRIYLLKQACAVVVMLIGLLTLSQYLAGWNLGIDQLLFTFKEPLDTFTISYPGRPAPNTALNFFLIGLGLLLLDWKTRHGRHPDQFLIIPAGVITLLGLLGYVYGSEELYQVLNYTAMAIPTAAVFSVLCLAILFARPDAGMMAIITNSDLGGILARRLLPIVFTLPAAVAWIGLLGERAGLVDADLSASLRAVTNIAILVIVTLAAARVLNRSNTARKQAEEALRKAGALQSAIFNSANFSSIATDAKGVIQIFNVGAERMLGYAAAEVMNRITPAEISDPQEIIARAEALSIELDTLITPGFEALVFKASRGIEDIYELTYIRKDGSRFPAVVSVTALRDDQNTIIGYLLIGTDNTARKQIESDRQKLSQRLRDHQFYTRTLFECNIDAIMTTDPDGIITDVNKQMERLTACTRDELIGSPFREYFTDSVLAEASINLVLSKKILTNYELTARARDGKETMVSYNATTFYDRNRKLQGVFAAARDVTERNNLDLILKEKNIELEVINKEMEDFSYSVSHDLRAPLRAIDGFSRKLVIGYGERLDDEGRRLLQVVRDNAQKMGQLIDNLLAFSRMGRREIILQPIDMDSMVKGVVDELRASEPERSIEFSFLTLPPARGDIAMMRQVWVNLLSNAVKFTRQRETAHIEVGCRAEDGELHYWVKDDGAGFDMQYSDKLFGVFQRLHRQDEFEGVGVGLAIVQRILHRHNGRIWGEGKPEEGATLHFALPLPSPDK